MAETGWEAVVCMTGGKYQKKHWVQIIKGEREAPEKNGEEIFAEICTKALNRGDVT